MYTNVGCLIWAWPYMCSRSTKQWKGLLQMFTIFYPQGHARPRAWSLCHHGRSSPETDRAWVAKDFALATQGLPVELLGVSLLQGKMVHLWSPAEAFLPPWHKLSVQRTCTWTWPWGNIRTVTPLGFFAGNGPQGDFGLFDIICADRSLVIILGCKSTVIPLLGSVWGLLPGCPHKPCSTHAEQIWPQPRDFACATWLRSVSCVAWQTLQLFLCVHWAAAKKGVLAFSRWATAAAVRAKNIFSLNKKNELFFFACCM